MRVDFHRIDAAHQGSALVDAAQVFFVKITTTADVVGGKGDRHKGLGDAAVNHRRAALGMLALPCRQAEAVGQEGFHQDNHLAAVVRPHPGLVEGQGDVVIGAAFAAPYTGKRCVH
ncbi:hypothetical protein D3C84_726900 [compost metagenome]